MSRTLEYAGMPYLDRTPFLDSAQERGLRIEFRPVTDMQYLFRRQAQDAAFESSEMSLSTYTVLTSRGDRRFVGLPVFTSRSFRHRSLFVRADSDISSPKQLRGARVGVQEYQMTAAVWVRGLLQDEYGVAPEDVRWFTGGLDEPGYKPRLAVDLPRGVELTVIDPDQDLCSLLGRGELDALITVREPRHEPAGGMRLLFEDAAVVEHDYFRRTGIFPIMHLVVVRRDRYEEDPSLAADLAAAFADAKHAGQARMRRYDCLAVELPWLRDALAEVDDLFGGDAFPYGLEPNRKNLEKALEYSQRQGLSERPVSVEELFAPEALAALA